MSWEVAVVSQLMGVGGNVSNYVLSLSLFNQKTQLTEMSPHWKVASYTRKSQRLSLLLWYHDTWPYYTLTRFWSLNFLDSKTDAIPMALKWEKGERFSAAPMAEAAEAAQILHTSERFQTEGDGLKRLLSGAHFSRINGIDVFSHRTHYWVCTHPTAFFRAGPL